MLHKCAVFILMKSFTHSKFAFLLWIYLSILRHTNFLSSFPSFWHFSSCMLKHLPCDYKHLRTDLQLNNSPLCVWTISQMLIMLFTHTIFTCFTFFWLWKSKKYHEIGFWPLSLNLPHKTICFILVQFFFTLLLIKTLRARVKIQCSSQPPFVLKSSHRKCSHLLRVKLNNSTKPS